MIGARCAGIHSGGRGTSAESIDMGHQMAGALVAVVASLVLLAWVFQRAVIYFPSQSVPAPRAVGLSLAEPVTFPTDDGLTLRGWIVPAARTPPRWTVLVLNGNGGNRAYRAPLAAALQRQGLQVLLFDYRGYGGNPGAPTEEGLRADAAAARDFLVARRGVDPARLIYFGESLGTTLAVSLAVDHPPAGLILRSPFPSLIAVGRVHYPFLPVRLLLRDRFVAIDGARQVTSPVLVVAGSRDRIVPLEQSRRVYAAVTAQKTLVVIEGAGHNDAALLAGEELVAAMKRFWERL